MSESERVNSAPLSIFHQSLWFCVTVEVRIRIPCPPFPPRGGHCPLHWGRAVLTAPPHPAQVKPQPGESSGTLSLSPCVSGDPVGGRLTSMLSLVLAGGGSEGHGGRTALTSVVFLFFRQMQQQQELDGGIGRDAAYETSQVSLPQVNTLSFYTSVSPTRLCVVRMCVVS